MRKFWTPEYLAWLATTYRQHRIAAIPPLFEAQFGIAISASGIKSALSAYHIRSGRPKGLLPGERPGPTWSPDRIAWLRAHRAEMTIGPLTDAFNAAHGTDLQPHSVANALQRYGIASPRTGRFDPGVTPWNSGLKGYQAGGRSRETQFKPGLTVWHQMPVWSYRQDTDGYWFFKFRQEAPAGWSRRDWVAVHRLNWEAAHGPLAAGQVVIMLDTDPSHCDLDNLAMLTRRELVYFNNLNHSVPPERELRRALVARVKLLAAAHRRAEALGMTITQRHRALGVMRRPASAYGPRVAG